MFSFKMPKSQKPKTWTDSEKRQLAKLAKRGAGVSKISTELGRYARSVKLMAREMGLMLKK
jgi:transposase-like protein